MLALALLVVGCGATSPASDAGPPADAAAPVDAGVDATSPPLDMSVDAPSGADAPIASDTWSTFAMGFFASYCTRCHAGPPGSTRDYRTMADVVRDQALIRCGVATTVLSGCGSFPPPRQFPIGTGPHPSDAERDRLTAWIDAGLPP